MTDEQKTETPAAHAADDTPATTPPTQPAAHAADDTPATTPPTQPATHAADSAPAPTPPTQPAAHAADSAPAPTPVAAAPAQNPLNLVLFGTLMLVVGMLAGYFGRPLITQAVSDQALRDSGVAVEEPAAAPASDPAAPASEPAAPASGEQAAPASGEQAAVPTPTDEDMQQLMTFLVDNTRHFKGDPNAPVTIIEFSDFQCPYCSQFANETGKQLEAEYIDTGLVRFGYLHYPFLGEGSVTSAEASECAADQGEFWAYHDRLVERVAVEGQRDFTAETLSSFAAELDLDTAAFDECLNGGTHAGSIQEATTLAQTIGVRSTPTFLINGEPLLGAQPYEAFEQIIEQELAAVGAAAE